MEKERAFDFVVLSKISHSESSEGLIRKLLFLHAVITTLKNRQVAGSIPDDVIGIFQ